MNCNSTDFDETCAMSTTVSQIERNEYIHIMEEAVLLHINQDLTV